MSDTRWDNISNALKDGECRLFDMWKGNVPIRLREKYNIAESDLASIRADIASLRAEAEHLQKLSKDLLDALPSCSCHRTYKNRRLINPECLAHDYEDEAQALRAALASPVVPREQADPRPTMDEIKRRVNEQAVTEEQAEPASERTCETCRWNINTHCNRNVVPACCIGQNYSLWQPRQSASERPDTDDPCSNCGREGKDRDCEKDPVTLCRGWTPEIRKE